MHKALNFRDAPHNSYMADDYESAMLQMKMPGMQMPSAQPPETRMHMHTPDMNMPMHTPEMHMPIHTPEMAPQGTRMPEVDMANVQMFEMRNMVLTMAYVPDQQWDKTYEPDTGLSRGTIFPELDKPFMGKGGFLRGR
ncbi:MAG: spore coat associated protein CotJA [Bacillota bacterium]|nr:spore coat associated protein CotJA [Bacillota bacterium]